MRCQGEIFVGWTTRASTIYTRRLLGNRMGLDITLCCVSCDSSRLPLGNGGGFNTFQEHLALRMVVINVCKCDLG